MQGSCHQPTELSQLSGQPRDELAAVLVEIAAAEELETASTVWLRLATDISPKASPPVPKAALERVLGSRAARLADGVGDGPWSPTLEVGPSAEGAVAGLIWFCLGLPHARDRWRAAHAVRTLARFGRWSVIDALFGQLNAPGAGPFQDQRLPFFVMHAKQWFLLAVARISLDYPGEIKRHRERLGAIALDHNFPHVGLREPSRRALLFCLKGSTSRSALKLKDRLEEVHASPFPPVQRQFSTFGTMSWDRPKTSKKPQPAFHFDYDFDKHDLSRVGNMFAVPTWKVADRCVSWIRRWDPTIEHMHDFGGRERPSGYSSYALGSEESSRAYGAYLARHALALEAGRLLQTTPLSYGKHAFGTWEEWLSRHSPTRADGLWLSDGLGEVPLFALHDLMADDAKGLPGPCRDESIVNSLAGVGCEGIGQSLMVEGSWSSPDGVRVRVASALVPPAQADIAGRAVATASPMDMWLPTLERDEDGDDSVPPGRSDMAPLEAWITDVHIEAKIDDGDPFASREAVERARPARRVVKALHLRPTSPWPHTWMAPAKRTAFRSLAWGRTTGRGDRERSDSGSALLCDSGVLSRLLTEMDRDLLLLIKLEHYRERSDYHTKEEDPVERFTHSYSILLIDRTLRVQPIRAGTVDVAAVASLGQHSSYDFQKRLAALARP